MVRAFWREKFIELNAGARILDIAAGNGAIATIAAELGAEKNKGFFVAATDLASIHADINGEDATREARSSIEFHSRIPCEQQPFDDDSFDMVVSQFGFEYSNVEKTLSEVRRILVPGGRFIAISHHLDSVLIELSKVELEIYRLAMDELDLIGTSRRYFEALGELGGDPEKLKQASKKAQPLSEEINDKMNVFRNKYPEHDCAQSIVDVVSYVARSALQTTLQDRLEELQKADNDFSMARARLNDMVQAALSREQIEALTPSARSAGFESVHCLRLFGDDSSLAGWQIHLR